MDNNNQMCQHYWSYITIIIYFQNTTYKFGLDIF